MPWRETNDAYTVWLSEIILQQTRVSQGIDYFHRFITRFPDVHQLAAADEQEVIKLWQGLGYYTRARNLLAAAQQVENEFGGQFPSTCNDLLKLKGVGTYTAAAVASIAFNEPVAVVDGNVARVLARLYAVRDPVNVPAGEKQIAALAGELLSHDEPGDHNQAMMEFGALQCVPAGPDCPGCPVRQFCRAYSQGLVAVLPVKQKKGKVRNRYFTYVIITEGMNSGKGAYSAEEAPSGKEADTIEGAHLVEGADTIEGAHTYITRRTGEDIWKEMYEFPLIEHESEPDEAEVIRSAKALTGLQGNRLTITAISDPVHHLLTHRRIIARFLHLEIAGELQQPPAQWKRVKFSEVGEHPLPRLIDRYLEQNGDRSD